VKRNKERGATTVEAVVALVMLLVLVGGTVFGGWACSSWKCSSRWSGSGMRTEWGPIKGCIVEASPGKFVPERFYRVTP
jgi:hypothetical protein